MPPKTIFHLSGLTRTRIALQASFFARERGWSRSAMFSEKTKASLSRCARTRQPVSPKCPAFFLRLQFVITVQKCMGIPQSYFMSNGTFAMKKAKRFNATSCPVILCNPVQHIRHVPQVRKRGRIRAVYEFCGGDCYLTWSLRLCTNFLHGPSWIGQAA